MIDPKIKKLTKVRDTEALSPCIEDTRVGLELLKGQHPKMTRSIARYIYTHVRGDVVDEYCTYNLDLGYPSLKWKDNDT